MTKTLPAAAGNNAVRNLRMAGMVNRVLLAGLLWVGSTMAVMAANFTVGLDRDTIGMGETATMSLRFENGKPSAQLAIPAVDGLSIRYMGPKTEIQSDFTHSVTTVSYIFSVTPTREGEFTIPAIDTEIDGQKFNSQPLTLKVVKSPPIINPKLVFLKLVVPKTEIYLGEILPVEIQLYLAQQVRPNEMPHVREEGFTLGKMLQPTQTTQAVENGSYQVATFRTCVAAAKVGKLQLGPATMAVSVPKPNSRRSFGFNQLLDWAEATLESEPLEVQVLPLPMEKVPPGFNGAVGYYSMTMSVSPTNVAIGDPVTIKVQISGKGSLSTVSLPSQDDWQQFKLYPPTSDFQPSDELGMNGAKSFVLTAVPQSMDIQELPPFRFSFFDPVGKQYRTLMQAATPLIVRPSAASSPAPVVVNQSSGDQTPKAQDLAHIKARIGELAQIQAPLVQRPWFLALQGIPVVAWLSLLISRKQKERLANNPRLRRQREVEKTIRDGLDELQQAAAANEAETFYATVFHLLQEQLGERLDLPASAITEAVIEERLRPMQMPEPTLGSLRELFQSCNQARYARQTTHEQLQALIPKLETALNEVKGIKA